MRRTIVPLALALAAFACAGCTADRPGRPTSAGPASEAAAVADAATAGAATTSGAAAAPLPPAALAARPAPGAAGFTRALWISRWSFRSPEDVRRLVRKAGETGFDVVFFQVRGRADALYRSSLEPWAAELTGTLGADPGWDPLAVALEAGREAGVAIHAWINVMPVWSGTPAPPRSDPAHLLRAHPDWLAVDADGRPQRPAAGGYLCLAPGVPAARRHVVAVVEDLLARYPVAGVHLDYVRTCARTPSRDAVSLVRFAEARLSDPGLSAADFSRDQVTALVRAVADAVHRRGLPVTAAVWHNYALDLPGTTGYGDYHQDARRWAREGLVDALVPMTYLRRTSRPGFEVLARDHLAHREGAEVWLGVHVLGRDRPDEADPTGAALLENLALAEALGADGAAVFAAPLLDAHGLWNALAEGPFAAAAADRQNPAASPSPRGSEAP